MSGDSFENSTQLVRIMKKKETTRTVAYRKLVVPVSMRSIYWKFFGFPATEDGEMLTKLKIVCTLCKTQIAYNKNTSNLRMHLQNRHPQDLLRIESEASYEPSPIKQDKKVKRARKTPKGILNTSLAQYCVVDDSAGGMYDQSVLENSIKYEGNDLSFQVNVPNVAVQQNMSSAKDISPNIIQLIIQDLIDPTVIEGPGFLKMVVDLKSPCELPEKSKITNSIIPDMYSKCKEELRETLKSVTGEVAIAIEEWGGANSMPYLSVSVYYYAKEDELCYKMLSTFLILPGKLASSWEAAFERLFASFNINIDKISAVVYATSNEEVIVALQRKGITLIPCLDYMIQLCAHSCFENEDIKEILRKIRETISFISRQEEVENILKDNELQNDIDVQGLKMDNENIWTTTLTMLENANQRKEIIQQLIEIYADDLDKLNMNMTIDDWEVVEELCHLLEPFRMTVSTLSDEKIPLASIIKPLIWQIKSSSLKIEPTDSEIVQNLKQGLSNLLVYKYTEHQTSSFLQVTSVLDPRFKAMQIEDDDIKEFIGDHIKDSLTQIMANDTNERKPIVKQERVSGISLLLGNSKFTVQTTNPRDRADREYMQYLAELPAGFEQCPAQWWSRMSSKYQDLPKLARTYLCVPCCACLPNKISIDNRMHFFLKRSMFSCELIDKILFLHINHTY